LSVKILARVNNVSIEAIEFDIIQNDLNLAEESFDLIIMFRFLHRPLFEKIKNWLKPSGIFLIETFSIEAEKFGKPKRKQLMLKPEEIKHYFKEMQVSKNYHRTISDGRPLIGCIVNKTVSSGEFRVTSKSESES
jgi:SAM-dependent methyltransferase